MFTGIIQTIGKVKGVEKKGSSAAIITIDHNGSLTGINIGDSVAVDGACLTVVKIFPSHFEADISGETMRLTTLGSIKAGERVNLEKSLTPSTPMGGHFVTGHVDGVGFIIRKTAEGEFAVFDFNIPNELRLNHIAKKGSVALDGISLTVADLTSNGFRVAIIPHTLKNTTLSLKKQGDRVNIETDVLAKYVERFLSANKQGIDEAFLKKHGF
ncbi:MAG: riboflavin synthase [Deltaproteobacteria bacterium]|nr:riboflavin synthase [Deltaproteobacteria bacterium]